MVGAGVEGAGVDVVATEVAPAIEDVADAAAGVGPADGVDPTPVEQPAKTKTASRPAARRPVARGGVGDPVRADEVAGLPADETVTIESGMVVRMAHAEAPGARFRKPVRGHSDRTCDRTRIRCLIKASHAATPAI
jgi:hypothetical protein